MKQATVVIAAFSVWLLAAPTHAQENPLYFGIKAGQMDPDADGFDEATNVGLIAGYDLSRDANGTLALEVEYTRSLSEGDVRFGGEWEIETLAGYGAYRTAGDVYVKAKAGVLSEDVKVSRTGGAIASGKDSGFSFGAGVGVRLNRKVGLEIEYTIIEEDIGFLSLGYFTHF